MNPNNLTSLELSKKFAEAGCELDSEHKTKCELGGFLHEHSPFGCGEKLCEYCQHMRDGKCEALPAYDILNDICVKHRDEFFDDVNVEHYIGKIFWMMCNHEKQEAEDYIWENCLFNPKNK